MNITKNTLVYKKRNKDTNLSKDSMECEECLNGQSNSRMNSLNDTNTNKLEDLLLEKILASDNMNQAYKNVMKNKGSRWVDKIEIYELLKHLKLTRKK